MQIRAETENDFAAIHQVNVAAFESDSEARLVEALRDNGAAIVSLVAEEHDEIIGHILFSPMTVAGRPECKVAGLAPMAVVPAWQNQGVGSALVREGLERCRRLGYGAVMVLGHPHYYPRFGFVPAVQYGIHSEYDVPEEVFMVLELVPEALKGVSGVAQYHPVFASF